MEYFVKLPLGYQIVIGYVAIINVITFFYFGLDKMKSIMNKGRRVPEKVLWFFTFIGGTIGALLGMWFFQHKTSKLSFQAGIAIILSLQIVGILFGVNYFR